ncbi:hypothetical protein BDY24DRAFT_403146 [Mrakia frigida]|uniref:uncharacterized protein n=1 Tax=Mrakia frigida TaxID=29902 RepID=UPI003FCC2100
MVDHQNKRQGSLTLSSGRARSVKLEEDVDVAVGFKRLAVAPLVQGGEAEGGAEQGGGAVEAFLSDLLEDMECPVCLDILVAPVLTRCSHTICHRDVEDWKATGKDDCPTCRSKDAYPASQNLAIENLMEKWLPKALDEDALQEWIQRKADWVREKPAVIAAVVAARARPVAPLPARRREGAPPPEDLDNVLHQHFLADRQRRAQHHAVFGHPRARLPPVPAQRPIDFDAIRRGFIFDPRRGDEQRNHHHANVQLLGNQLARPLNGGWDERPPRRANPNPVADLRPPPALHFADDAAAAMRAVERANRNLADAIDRQARVLQGPRHLPLRQNALPALPPPVPAAAPPPAQARPQEPRRRAQAREQGPALRRDRQALANGLRRAMREFRGGEGERRVRFELPGGEDGEARAAGRGGARDRVFAGAPAGALGALHELADQVSRL